MKPLNSYIQKFERLENRFNISLPIGISFLFILTLAMFYSVLFTLEEIVLSNKICDVATSFSHWRMFGFEELRKGNLALWNPYMFSGVPFLGGFQSALLYPLNILFLFLPLSKAINTSIALHVFLVGVFMYLWARHRRLNPMACFFSSVLLMFCGAHFLHVYAGHLVHLCSMTWAPLIFLSIDGLFEDRSFGWCLLGTYSLAMQLLAGYPQYFFYTAVSVLLYSGFCIIKAKERLKIIAGLIGIYGGAFLLSAVQVLTGIQAGQESVRGGGLSYEFAAKFSLPPENFLTLLVPSFFGNNISFPYWGRWYLWEMSFFISVTGFILAIYGALYGNRNARRFSVTMALLLLILALGAHTPLFRILYERIPGFNLFRGNSKFIFHATLFMIMLAGIGLDHMIRAPSIPRQMIVVIIIIGLVFGAMAFGLRHSVMENPQGFWQKLMYKVPATHESYLPAEKYSDIEFSREAGLFAFKWMVIASGMLILVSILLSFCKFYRWMPYMIAIVGIIEIFLFAKSSRATFDLAAARPLEMERFRDEHPGDYRIAYFDIPNSAVSLGMSNIWGYAPDVLRRYAEFMAFTQGRDPNKAGEYLRFSYFHPLFRMLRCRYVFTHEGDKIKWSDAGASMSRVVLIQDWLLIPDRDQIFKTMSSDTFNPHEKVILQTPPSPEPSKSEKIGSVKILNSSTDHLTIEALLPSPQILLITDPYSKGWKARDLLRGSTQRKYNVMPANYILQAIPLSKGYHLIRVEYEPLAFQIGKWPSLLSIVVYLGLLGWYSRKRRFLN